MPGFSGILLANLAVWIPSTPFSLPAAILQEECATGAGGCETFADKARDPKTHKQYNQVVTDTTPTDSTESSVQCF